MIFSILDLLYLMDKLNQEYIVLLTGEGSPSDKFWELYKRIREDKRGPGVLLRISWTDFICNLIALINAAPPQEPSLIPERYPYARLFNI